MTEAGKTVSLVLGGGGAQGLAHIGIIEWLVAHGYQIKSIAGYSMGALGGGTYAAGKLDMYAEWAQTLEKTDVLRFLDLSFRPAGLFKGERIITVLKNLIGDFGIETLPISYTAAATDLDTGKEVWLSKGSLFDAIRASIAIPTVFTHYAIKDRLLADGGLVNPVAIAPTLRDITDITIAVDLSGPPDPKISTPKRADRRSAENPYRRRVHEWVDSLQSKLPLAESQDRGLIEIITRSFETMQATVTRLKLAAHPPDVVITVPRNSCRFFELHGAAELIEFGRDITNATPASDNDEPTHTSVSPHGQCDKVQDE